MGPVAGANAVDRERRRADRAVRSSSTRPEPTVEWCRGRSIGRSPRWPPRRRRSRPASTGTTITVTARDANNNLIGGATVTLASTGSGNTFGSTTLTTGTSGATLGKATTTYTSTKAEAKSISAEITASGVTVDADAGRGDGEWRARRRGDVDGDGVPATVTGLANGSTITITVKDANGNPVSGTAPWRCHLSEARRARCFPDPSRPPTRPAQTTARCSQIHHRRSLHGPGDDRRRPDDHADSRRVDVPALVRERHQGGIFDTPFNLGGAGVTTPCSSCHLPDRQRPGCPISASRTSPTLTTRDSSSSRATRPQPADQGAAA